MEHDNLYVYTYNNPVGLIDESGEVSSRPSRMGTGGGNGAGKVSGAGNGSGGKVGSVKGGGTSASSGSKGTASTSGGTKAIWKKNNKSKSKSKESDSALGGAYKNVPSKGGEVHHMPANSVSPLSRGTGPGIRMDKLDHRKTASWGSSREARIYREKQKTLINQGKFAEAQYMDIIDIRNKFGSKYDRGIQQMLEYTKKIY